jgi:TatD DNase family protein
MISIIDTHAHIDLPDFDEDRQAMVARAMSAGVHAVVVIGFCRERWVSTAALVKDLPFVVRAVGLHPNHASEWSPAVLDGLQHELEGDGVVAIGEIGLDFYRDHADPDLQLEAFEAQLRLAIQRELPIVIHQRSAESAVIEVLAPYAPLRGVMHCFSGDRAFAAQCLSLGLHLGVGGVATFPKSGAVREALTFAPLDRIIVETDAPYLAPQGHRGKRNEPAWIVAALDVLASIHGVTLDQMSQATSANAERLFGEQLTHARRAGAELAGCA